MAEIIVSGHLELSSLTQAEENALALTLAGLPRWSSTIWNSTLGVKRYWDGSAFTTLTAWDTTILGYREITAPTVITPLDYTINAISGTFIQPLPTAVGIKGKIYCIKNTGTGIPTLDGFSAETIDGSLTAPVLTNVCLRIQSTGTNWIII